LATRARLKTLMDQELRSRASARRAAAGEGWTNRQMGFFFPRNEDTVDLCALTVLDRALAEDGTRVPPSVPRRLREVIGTPTKADDAITIIFLATAQPMRIG
jgi:hypothetical protein